MSTINPTIAIPESSWASSSYAAQQPPAVSKTNFPPADSPAKQNKKVAEQSAQTITVPEDQITISPSGQSFELVPVEREIINLTPRKSGQLENYASARLAASRYADSTTPSLSQIKLVDIYA